MYLIPLQDIAIVSIFTAISMTASAILLAITGVFGGRRSPAASGSSPPKVEGVLENWLSNLADSLKRFTGKTV